MWLSDGKFILPDTLLERGSLRIEEGRIAEIVEGPAPRPGLNLRGLTIFPGMVDLHGDMFEREIEPRPQALFPMDLALLELDKKMAACGITTAYAAVSFAWEQKVFTRTEQQARQMVETVNRLRPQLLTDHFLHARFEITNHKAGEILLDLVKQELVHLISVMDHTPGQGQYRDIANYMQFAIEWQKRETGREHTETEIREYIKKQQAAPKAWDTVHAIADIARDHHVTLASHDDDAIEKVRFLAGLDFHVSEFPVSLEAAREAKKHDIHVVMGAPNAFRGQSTTLGNLNAVEAIEAGIVDTLATDYYPAAMMEAVFAMARKGILPLREASKLVSQNPADAVELNDRGRIEIGRLADLVFVEEAERPRIHGTMRRGEPIYWDRNLFRMNPLDAIVN